MKVEAARFKKNSLLLETNPLDTIKLVKSVSYVRSLSYVKVQLKK